MDFDTLADTLIDDEKDFDYPHGFDNFNKGIHGASAPGHSTCITPGLISQKVYDQSNALE